MTSLDPLKTMVYLMKHRYQVKMSFKWNLTLANANFSAGLTDSCQSVMSSQRGLWMAHLLWFWRALQKLPQRKLQSFLKPIKRPHSALEGKQEKWSKTRKKTCLLNILLLNGNVNFLRSVEKAPHRTDVLHPSRIDSSLLLAERGYRPAQRWVSWDIEYGVICCHLGLWVICELCICNGKQQEHEYSIDCDHRSCLQHINAIHYTCPGPEIIRVHTLVASFSQGVLFSFFYEVKC